MPQCQFPKAKRILAAVLSCGVVAFSFGIAQYASADSTPSSPSTAGSILQVSFQDKTWNDQSSYHTVATAQGNPQVVYDSTLQRNVLSLDGSSYINYALNSTQLSAITNQFTMEAMFNMDSMTTPQAEGIFENMESGGIGIEYNNSTNSTWLSKGYARIGGKYADNGPAIQYGQYYYQTVTYNGSELDIYLNGQLANSITGLSGSVAYNTAVAMCLGGNPTTTGTATNIFKGKIAYANLEGSAISADQVAKDYNAFMNPSSGSSSTSSGSLPSSSGSSSGASSCGAGNTAGNLKVGVLSDLHLAVDQNTVGGDDINDAERETHLRNALNYYKQQGITLLVLDGDIADHAQPGGYAVFAQIFSEIFNDPKTAPQILATMGNHDYYLTWNGLGTADQERTNFIACMNQSSNFTTTTVNNGSNSNNNVEVVNGYYFIGLSTEGGDFAGDFTQPSLDWLKQQLDAAVKADPTKPIFVAFHQPVYNTLISSDQETAALDSVLKNYPQVVEFSGHTHSPLADERSIYQKDYTSVGTGVLYYVGGMPNINYIPDKYDFANGLLLNVSSSQVDIQRYDFHNNQPIKNDWVINAPFGDKSKFAYTDARTQSRTAPSFAAGTTISLANVSPTLATLNFNSAQDSDFVYSYEAKAVDTATGATAADLTVPSDFYLNINKMSSTQSMTISGLTPGHTYKISVYAAESFGLQSTPLTTTLTTPADSQAGQSVLKVDLSDGTANDQSSFHTQAKNYGTPHIVTDPSIGRKVIALDGRYNAVNYYLNDTQRAMVSHAFTLDVVFKMNTLQSQYIMDNLETAGFGLAASANGTVTGTAYIKGGYKTLTAGALKVGQYYNLTETYDGDKLRVYLNGQLIQTSADLNGTVLQNLEVPMQLGGNPYPAYGEPTSPFNGNIAYADIESNALSDAQIAQNYASRARWISGQPVSAANAPAQSGAGSSTMPVFISAINPNDINRSAMYPDAGSNQIMEYVELYNSSNSPVDINNSYNLYYDSSATASGSTSSSRKLLTVTADGTSKTGITIPAHSAAILWDKRVPSSSVSLGSAANFSTTDVRNTLGIPANIPVFVVQGANGWGNSADGIILQDKNGNEISSYYYTSSDVSGGCVRLRVPAAGTAMTPFMQAAPLTPGLVDPEQYSGDTTAPSISNVSDSTIKYQSSANISATVTDNTQVSSVSLYYRTDTGANTPFTPLSMTQGSGTTWSATLDSAFLTSNTLQYYVAASDGYNTSSTQNQPTTVLVEDAVQNVVDLINAIGTVQNTTASHDAIINARTAYNALPLSQQAQVSNYNTLIAAENAYAALNSSSNSSSSSNSGSSNNSGVSSNSSSSSNSDVSSNSSSSTSTGTGGVSATGSATGSIASSNASTDTKAANPYTGSGEAAPVVPIVVMVGIAALSLRVFKTKRKN
ncbi:MAG: LamG-like jellyroll fold domain-containing protein [Ethanoligenens sp.]